MNNNENNNNEKFDILDILSIISFIMQVKNIEEDKKQTKYINNVILAISNEIEKLHKENDIIMEKIDELRRLYGINSETKETD